MSISYISMPELKFKNLFQLTKDDIINSIKNAEDYEVVGNILATFHPSFTNTILNDTRIDATTLTKVLFGGGMDYSYLTLMLSNQSVWEALNIFGPGNQFPSHISFNRFNEVLQYIINNYDYIDVLNLPNTLIIQYGTASFEDNVLEVVGGDSYAYVKFNLNYDMSGKNVFLMYIDYDFETTTDFTTRGISLISSYNGRPYAGIGFGDLNLNSAVQHSSHYALMPPKSATFIILPSEASTFSELLVGISLWQGTARFKLYRWLLFPVGRVLASGTFGQKSFGIWYKPELTTPPTQAV